MITVTGEKALLKPGAVVCVTHSRQAPQFHKIVAVFKAPPNSPDRGHVLVCLQWLITTNDGIPFLNGPPDMMFPTCAHIFAFLFLITCVCAVTGSA